MRNKRVALTEDQTRAVAWAQNALDGFVRNGSSVLVTYVTRDGSSKAIRGRAVGYVGEDSTLAITVETENGFRSANLYRITSVSN